MTDDSGHLHVEFTVPESLTEWQVVAYAMGSDDLLGSGDCTFTTAVPVSGRLAVPRFLVEGDDVDLSVVAGNNGKDAQHLRMNLCVSDPNGKPQSVLQGGAAAPVEKEVVAGDTARADWRFHAQGPCNVLVTATAESPSYSDGMVMPLEVVEHGFAETVSRGGHFNGGTASVKLALPEHRAGSASLEVAADVGLAPAMLRALPYLVNYPYNCSEQTTSRVVPLALLVKRLTDAGWSRAKVLTAAGVDGEDAYAKILRDAEKDLDDADDYVGGWGWFDARHPDDYMTAYVLWGQMILKKNGIQTIDHSRLTNSWRHLCQSLPNYNKDPDMQAWMLFSVLNYIPDESGDKKEIEDAANDNNVIFSHLANPDTKLSASALAMTAMSAQSLGKDDVAKALCARLSKRATTDTEPGTGLHTTCWKSDAPLFYYSWSDNPVEATAWALMALARLDPQNPQIEGAVNWLVRERQSGRWESTRATCVALMVLEEVRQREKTVADGTLDVFVNGVKQDKPTTSTGHSFTFQIPESKLVSGNTVELRASDGLPVYYSATISYFDKRATIPATESGIAVSRRYYRIHEQPTLAAGPISTYAPLAEGESVTAGEEIEVRVTVRTAAELHYLMLEDAKPAGFELLESNSGYGLPAREIDSKSVGKEPTFTGRETWTYVEPRDRRRTAFVDDLPQGLWELRYRIRAETAGRFHALPAKMQAIYSPTACGNSAESQITVKR